MTRLQVRFRTIVGRYGEDVGGAPAVVAPLAPSKARTYVDDGTLAGTTRPIFIATAAYDHPATEGATVAWRTRTLRVERAVDVRLMGRTVARLLVLFPLASGGGGGGGPNGTSGPEPSPP